MSVWQKRGLLLGSKFLIGGGFGCREGGFIFAGLIKVQVKTSIRWGLIKSKGDGVLIWSLEYYQIILMHLEIKQYFEIWPLFPCLLSNFKFFSMFGITCNSSDVVHMQVIMQYSLWCSLQPLRKSIHTTPVDIVGSFWVWKNGTFSGGIFLGYPFC